MAFGCATVIASQWGMTCPEMLRLQQLYDVALRRWAQIQASSQLFGQPAFISEEARKRMQAERDAAKARLTMHLQNCKTCLQKPGTDA
jgi:hypothetical protein